MYTAGNLPLSDLFHVFSSSLLTAHGEIVPHCRALQTPSAVKPPGRLIASIVLVLRSAQREGGSSLCGIAIVSTPPFLLHQWAGPLATMTTIVLPIYKQLSVLVRADKLLLGGCHLREPSQLPCEHSLH